MATDLEILPKLTKFRETIDLYWDVFEYAPSFGNIALNKTPWGCWFALENLYLTFIDLFKTRPNIEQLSYERKQVNISDAIQERGDQATDLLNDFSAFLKSLTPLQIAENHVDLLGCFQYIESSAVGILSLQDPGFLARSKWELRMGISFPKCGRTWFQFCFASYMLSLRTKMRDVPETRMTTTHGGALEVNWASPSLYWFPVIRKLVHLNRKNVFIVRDPRDIIVSWYFHTTRREKQIDKKMLLSEFIRGEYTGMPRLVLFYNIWQYVISRHICPTIIIMRYEDMSKDMYSEMSRVLSFWELPIDKAILEKAVKASTFEKMQIVERNRGLKATDPDVYWELTPGNVNDPDSYKVRRGVIGGYVDYLSKDDIKYINNYLRDNLNNILPEFQYPEVNS